MTTSLTSDERDRLQPVLASLARLVAAGKSTGDEQLARLVEATDLSDNALALSELQRWARLLKDVRTDSSEDTRQTVIESLMLRGLAEAPVILAVSVVAGTHANHPANSEDLGMGDEPGPKRDSAAFQISEDALDFGVLAHNASATHTLRVEGASGRVTSDNDQLRLRPETFSDQPTSIEVTLRPGAAGVLWATLQFETADGIHMVPVIAQREAAPYVDVPEPTPEPIIPKSATPTPAQTVTPPRTSSPPKAMPPKQRTPSGTSGRSLPPTPPKQPAAGVRPASIFAMLGLAGLATFFGYMWINSNSTTRPDNIVVITATAVPGGSGGAGDPRPNPTYTPVRVTPKGPSPTNVPTGPSESEKRDAISNMIQDYNDIKVEAMSRLDDSRLSSVLNGDELTRRRRSVCYLRKEGQRYDYSDRRVDIESIEFQGGDQATVMARVGEHRVLRKDTGKVIKDYGFEEYRSIYNLVRTAGNSWRIKCLQSLEDDEPAHCEVTFEGPDPCQ